MLNYPDEGYIKYHCKWQKAEPLPLPAFQKLNGWRRKIYETGGIGFDSYLKVGYGNISQRYMENPAQFVISGTQTGHLKRLDKRHYTLVSAYNLADNRLTCQGPIKASSESLTHAAIYELDAAITAVIHIHHRPLWTYWKHRKPTTSEHIRYGTPEMAYEIQRLYTEMDLASHKVVIMAGHQDGIIGFGNSLEEAGAVLEKLNWLF